MDMDNANNDNTQRANKRDDLHDILRTFVDDPNNEVKTYCVSPFIELESVESVLKKHKGNFCVLSLNIQSLNSKFDSFMSVLSHLNDNNTHFQAICLQETWLSHDQDTSLFNIPGYHLIHRGKSCSNHSGLIIYLSDEFSYNVKDTLPGSQLWDGLFIDVYGESLCGNLTIGNIYRPPRHNNNNNTVRRFCSELQPVISNISKHDSNAIITGDFNIDLLQINERSEFQKYFDLFTTDGLFPCTTLPTRSSESLIDQIYCKLKDPKQLVFSCVIDTMISDHYPCFAIVDILKSRKHKPKFVQIHNHDPAAFRSFYEELSARFQGVSLNPDLCANPNDNYELFESIVVDTKSKYLAPKTVRFKKYKHRLSPWITDGILRSIKYRDKLFREVRCIPNGTDLHSSLSVNLSSYQTILKKTIRMAKCKYYADQFEKNKSNIRHTWSTTKEILSKKRNKKDFPNYFKLSDQHISDPMAIANHFNIFFANIGPELSKNLHSNSEKSVSSYMKQTIISSFNFECVNSETVEKIILELSSKNSCGSDGLSTNFLKRISKIIAAPLSVIINQSLVTGIFPDRLKIAKVIPLFKKGDDHVFDNYRPISLLSSISKVVEKIVFIQVYDYFSKQNLLYDGQYGFRKIHSTELAAVELVDRIRLYMDKSQIPLSVFLDLSKAFDTLDHSILLTKLNFYGFSGSALTWFQSYSSHRQQCVDFDGTVSDICTLSTGVPQGSILGPLLFIIYMNDIHIASE